MNSTQTAQTTQNSGKSTSPFDQIRELERRENERVEKELAGMQQEKEEVAQSVAKKEDQATEEMKAKAKEELKAYSESELAGIVASEKKEAEKECSALESGYEGKKKSAVSMLVEKAKNPEILFPDAA